MPSWLKWSFYVVAFPASLAVPLAAGIALGADWLLSIPAVVLIGLTIHGAIGYALFREVRFF